jgi:hypothetical protein
MPLKMKLTAITLDCPDPRALAAFYQQATGLELYPEPGDDFAGLTREDGLFIGFQRAGGYQAPSWPGQSVPQQLHLDSRSTTSTRPRPCYWNWAQPNHSPSPAATGDASSPTLPGTPSA